MTLLLYRSGRASKRPTFRCKHRPSVPSAGLPPASGPDIDPDQLPPVMMLRPLQDRLEL